MKPYLFFMLWFALCPSPTTQEVKLKNDSPAEYKILRHDLLAMWQIECQTSSEFYQAVVKSGMSLHDDSSLTTGQALKLGLHILKEYCVERNLSHQLKEIVDEFGWPYISQVGTDAASAAVTIVKIADHDRGFQKRCLLLMQEAPPGEVNLEHVAELTDELLIAEGKKQKFGTKFDRDGQPYPIENAESVDARRKAMQLPSLATQTKMIAHERVIFEYDLLYGSGEISIR